MTPASIPEKKRTKCGMLELEGQTIRATTPKITSITRGAMLNARPHDLLTRGSSFTFAPRISLFACSTPFASTTTTQLPGALSGRTGSVPPREAGGRYRPGKSSVGSSLLGLGSPEKHSQHCCNKRDYAQGWEYSHNNPTTTGLIISPVCLRLGFTNRLGRARDELPRIRLQRQITADWPGCRES